MILQCVKCRRSWHPNTEPEPCPWCQLAAAEEFGRQATTFIGSVAYELGMAGDDGNAVLENLRAVIADKSAAEKRASDAEAKLGIYAGWWETGLEIMQRIVDHEHFDPKTMQFSDGTDLCLMVAMYRTGIANLPAAAQAVAEVLEAAQRWSNGCNPADEDRLVSALAKLDAARNGGE